MRAFCESGREPLETTRPHRIEAIFTQTQPDQAGAAHPYTMRLIRLRASATMQGCGFLAFSATSAALVMKAKASLKSAKLKVLEIASLPPSA